VHGSRLTLIVGFAPADVYDYRLPAIFG
jgi:hypothetical protein